MSLPNRACSVVLAAGLALGTLAATMPAAAELRVSELDIFLNDHDVTVHVVLLGTIAPGFHEGLQSGIPAHVRYTIELWQYWQPWLQRCVSTKAWSVGPENRYCFLRRQRSAWVHRSTWPAMKLASRSLS